MASVSSRSGALTGGSCYRLVANERSFGRDRRYLTFEFGNEFSEGKAKDQLSLLEGINHYLGIFGQLENDVDAKSGVYIAYDTGRLDKGIPNPKVRPVLPLPWGLAFELTLFPNHEIQEQEILNLFEEGGRAIGLGTYRGLYGKFCVESWE